MSLPSTQLPPALYDPRELFAAVERTPLPDSIWALLQESAVERPRQVALRIIGGATYTYAELRDAVAAAANALLKRGVAPATRIAVLLPNIAEFPIAYLAAAQLGACVVPINTAYTSAEIEYVLRDSGAAFAIVDESLRANFEVAATRIALHANNVFVVNGTDNEQSWSRLCNGSPQTSTDYGGLEALMTIQYTSGTTGFPKGALLTQRYWLTVGLAQSAELVPLEVQNILVVHSFFYMDPYWQLMLAFVLRGTVVLAPRMSASNFMAWAREFKIHYGLVSTPIFKQPPNALDPHHTLKLLQTYGFSKEIHADFETRFQVPVREVYGMTEIGCGTFLPLSAFNKIGSGSVGIPAPFRRLKIVGSDGIEVAAGEVGELWVSGEGMFSGYNNLHRVGEEVLRGEWMRTGDLFRQDRDGYFYLVGRLKDMVRRNMENISTHEVEQVLLGHPGIAKAAVLAVPDAQKGEEVLAVIVLQDGETHDTVTPGDLRDHCALRLAKFKLPRYVGYRDTLPTTPSGKIAKGQLRRDWPELPVGCYDLTAAAWVKPSFGVLSVRDNSEPSS